MAGRITTHQTRIYFLQSCLYCKILEKRTRILLGYKYKIYNSGYNTEIINEQCNAGDPLETSGGLYRGPPSMLIYVNTIKWCACETLDLVQCSIAMNVKLLQ